MHLNRKHFKAQVTAINDQVKWDIDHHFNTYYTLNHFHKLSIVYIMLQTYLELSHSQLRKYLVNTNPVHALQHGSKCNMGKWARFRWQDRPGKSIFSKTLRRISTICRVFTRAHEADSWCYTVTRLGRTFWRGASFSVFFFTDWCIFRCVIVRAAESMNFKWLWLRLRPENIDPDSSSDSASTPA